jgi:hypothetical protein
MAHNENVMPGGKWPTGLPPLPSRMRRMDQLSSETIDGDAGGTWAPVKPIIIGGAGVTIYSLGGFAGTVQTAPGALAGGALVLGDNDYPTAALAHTRTQTIGLRDFFNRRDRINPEDAATGFYPLDESMPGTLKNISNVLHPSAARFVGPIPSARLIQGAILLSMTLKMRVPTAPLGMPTTMPGFRIVRVAKTGAYSTTTSDLYLIPTRANTHAYVVGDLVIPSAANARQFRCTIAGTSAGAQPAAFGTASAGDAVVDGGVTWRCELGPNHAYGHYCRLARAADSNGYYAGGNVQSISASSTYLQNNTINLATYSYMLEIIDESNAGGFIAANLFHSLSFTLTGLTTMRPTY